jgi:hypothetical protein
MDMTKEYLSWNDVEDLTGNMIESMIDSDWIPTAVVGLTRGGLAPATMISHYFNVPMCSLDVSLRDNTGPFGGTTSTWIPEEIANDHQILVVDDINDTGATFEWIRNDWSKTVAFIPAKTPEWPWTHIKFAALIHNEPSNQPSDFYGKLINKDKVPCWICFPWEYWHQNND